MPANTNPIFLATPNVSWATLTTANTGKDGTGTVATIFTAGANGGRVEKVVATHLGTNVQTVLRIFVNNGGANSTPANNSLVAEATIPANTTSETTEQTITEIPFTDMILPAGYRLLATIGTTVASGLQITAFGGNF